ncbi:mRNA export factor GLE1-like [Littorina saxatilis]
MAHSIANTKATLMSTLDSCPHKQYLSEAAEKTRMLVRKLEEQAAVLLGSADRSGPLEEIMAKLKHFQQQSQNALDFVVSLTAEAEKKAKEEQQRQQTAPAPQPQAVQGQPTPQTGQTPSSQSVAAAAGEEGALAAVAKVYTDNVKLLSQMDAALQPFVGDQQMKKVRFDLQRAVNTPVNAISAVNSAHLRDKLMRLRCLLKGEMVEVIGKRVSAQAVPQGITFCKNLVAKMIARKADEQVSSSHESAYGVAAVAVGLWCEFPDVGELLMAHLQALCPYVVPFYPPRLPNQSTVDYHKTLGYRVDEDGTIEQQDKFLRRMSGLMRLYAAIMVTSPPQGAQLAHPHGLEHAWIWLTRMLNLQPNPDITAAAVYDMLQVTGNFLLKAYRVQFVKLIYCLYKVFLPKLKAVAAGTGPVSRLETFLETTMKNSAFIPEPEGYINPRFWNF